MRSLETNNFPRSFLSGQTYLCRRISPLGGEKSSGLLLRCVSFPPIPSPSRAESIPSFFSATDLRAERVICRPDLENCGNVLDLSTRTERRASEVVDVPLQRTKYCGRRLKRVPTIDQLEFTMNLMRGKTRSGTTSLVFYSLSI